MEYNQFAIVEVFRQHAMSIQLIMKTEDGSSRTFDLLEARTTIGRRRTCDLRVALPTVAPLHCEITITDGIVQLMNRAPDAETFHNDVIVDRVQLADSDKVKIGPVEFTVIHIRGVPLRLHVHACTP